MLSYLSAYTKQHTLRFKIKCYEQSNYLSTMEESKYNRRLSLVTSLRAAQVKAPFNRPQSRVRTLPQKELSLRTKRCSCKVSPKPWEPVIGMKLLMAIPWVIAKAEVPPGESPAASSVEKSTCKPGSQSTKLDGPLAVLRCHHWDRRTERCVKLTVFLMTSETDISIVYHRDVFSE